MKFSVIYFLSVKMFQISYITYTEYITQWLEHMKFIFSWKKYFTSECFDMSVSKITLILPCLKQRNDVSDIFISEDMENMTLVSRM